MDLRAYVLRIMFMIVRFDDGVIFVVRRENPRRRGRSTSF